MTQATLAYVGAAIHDGTTLHADSALVCFADGRADIVRRAALPAGLPTADLAGGTIMPGFVDLQVNGGGGIMFNDDQSVAALRSIAQAHAGIGTAALLPTLITDTPARTRGAIAAVAQAIAEKVPGIIGIHLEGPHLSIARKGAHDPALIRPMTDADVALLLAAAQTLPNVMLTVAPENTTLAQIRALAAAGIIVSLGHTDAGYDTCMAAFDAGARCATHLFNAMSPLGNREPGLVGAALSHGGVFAGLIADGIHVHPATIRTALAAKTGPGRMFLVTDAMATAGSAITRFSLNGRTIIRDNGRLRLQDGTLAGADLEMTRAIAVLVDQAGAALPDAIAMATAVPAQLLRHNPGHGRFDGRRAGLLHADAGLTRITDLQNSQAGGAI